MTRQQKDLVQEGRRGFMAGVAELKAGPTQEQQQHARALRERLLADLQQQVPLTASSCRQSQKSALSIGSDFESSVEAMMLHESTTPKMHICCWVFGLLGGLQAPFIPSACPINMLL